MQDNDNSNIMLSLTKPYAKRCARQKRARIKRQVEAQDRHILNINLYYY